MRQSRLAVLCVNPHSVKSLGTNIEKRGMAGLKLYPKVLLALLLALDLCSSIALRGSSWSKANGRGIRRRGFELTIPQINPFYNGYFANWNQRRHRSERSVRRQRPQQLRRHRRRRQLGSPLLRWLYNKEPVSKADLGDWRGLDQSYSPSWPTSASELWSSASTSAPELASVRISYGGWRPLRTPKSRATKTITSYKPLYSKKFFEKNSNFGHDAFESIHYKDDQGAKSKGKKSGDKHYSKKDDKYKYYKKDGNAKYYKKENANILKNNNKESYTKSSKPNVVDSYGSPLAEPLVKGQGDEYGAPLAPILSGNNHNNELNVNNLHLNNDNELDNELDNDSYGIPLGNPFTSSPLKPSSTSLSYASTSSTSSSSSGPSSTPTKIELDLDEPLYYLSEEEAGNRFRNDQSARLNSTIIYQIDVDGQKMEFVQGQP